MRSFLLVVWSLQIANEDGGAHLRHFLARGAANREVGGNEADAFLVPKFRGEPLEHRVRVWRVANFERPVASVFANSVEDDPPAGAFHRNEARELIDQLARAGERAGVKHVVAVE